MLDNLTNKFQMSSMRFEHMTIAMPLHALTQTILFLIIPFTGTYETNKLTCSHSTGFIAQLVREVLGLNPFEDT